MGLKVVFFGTPDFAVASLDALVQNGFDVLAVVRHALAGICSEAICSSTSA